MSELTSLLSRSLEHPLFMELERSNRAGQDWRAEAVSCGTSIRRMKGIAEVLPDVQYVINLCQSRSLFTLGFCAAILRGQCSLLPQNSAKETLQQLIDEYPSVAILHDGQGAGLAEVPSLNVRELVAGEFDSTLPVISPDQLVAIAFTSGSTGKPKGNKKSWRTFVESSRTNARYMLPSAPCTLVATVPPQHMWGMETSVLFALFADVTVLDSKPFFPKDIVDQLQMMPHPRVLVSTPVHLRALLKSGLNLPKVDRVLCATAPLGQELAQQLESALGATLVEVYGCSEVGSMASRATAREDSWHLFDNLTVRQAEESMEVIADHLPCSVPFQDRAEWLGPREFRLQGRNDDMLEVAGKRGSLQELNRILIDVDGVSDGVVFVPDNPSGAVARPVALVVNGCKRADEQGGATKEKIQAHFTDRLDAVFMPRPIVFVDQLPREPSGKLRRSELMRFWSELNATYPK